MKQMSNRKQPGSLLQIEDLCAVNALYPNSTPTLSEFKSSNLIAAQIKRPAT